jgi:hypothetical protein
MAWWNPLRLFTPKPPELLLEEVVDGAWRWYRDGTRGLRGIRFGGRYRGAHEAVRARIDGIIRSYALSPCGPQLWSRHDQHATTYALGRREWLELYLPPPRSTLEVEFELVNGGTAPDERRALVRDIITLIADAGIGQGYHGHPMAYPLPCVHFEHDRKEP